MPNNTPADGKSFEENIDALLEELRLANRWRRPSILLAVNKSKPGQDKAEKALENKLRKEGQSVVRMEVNPELPNIAQVISQTPNADNVVFFVSNIDRGGGTDGRDSYRGLNLHREFFVENRIRAVFWLTMNEALKIPIHAPDFWAFRHRVIEFASPRAARKIKLPAGVLIWHIRDSVYSPRKLEEQLAARQKMLLELPIGPESSSARAELIYTLGYLSWRMGNPVKASNYLNAGLELARSHDLHHMDSSLLNGAAILRYEAQEYREAVEIFKKAIGSSPQDGLLPMNLSVTLHALGRNQEALTLSKRALRIAPTDPRIWNALGHLYLSMGKPDEALPCFEKATELAPTAANYHASLAISHRMIGDAEGSIRQINAARKSADDRGFYLDICRQALLDNRDKLLELLRAAFNANQISKNDVRRDPNFRLLFDPPELDALLDAL